VGQDEIRRRIWMKEPLKKFLKNHWKPVISVLVLSLLVVGILIYSNMDSIDNPVKVVTDTDTLDTQKQRNLR